MDIHQVRDAQERAAVRRGVFMVGFDLDRSRGLFPSEAEKNAFVMGRFYFNDCGLFFARVGASALHLACIVRPLCDDRYLDQASTAFFAARTALGIVLFAPSRAGVAFANRECCRGTR